MHVNFGTAASAVFTLVLSAFLAACGGGGGGGGGGGSAATSHDLTIAKTGSGTGSVSGSPGTLNCGSTCTATFDQGTNVTLTATPANSSAFTGWSGACSGSAAQTVVTVDAAKSCSASFALLHTISVSKTGAGSGSVTSNPVGIECGATCNAEYVEGSSLALTAVPSAGSAFVQWGGDCSGTAAAATVVPSRTRTCTARFEPAFELAITALGTGNGRVSSNPVGIDCSTTCSSEFVDGSVVTLTATAAAGSTFAGWNGACAGGAATIGVTMGGARACTATFDAASPLGLSEAGYHLVALAGLGDATTSTIRFADGATEQASPDALYAVNVLTGTGHQIGAAGEWGQLELPVVNRNRALTGYLTSRTSNRANQFESAFDPATGLIRDYRIRVSTFARAGRLYKVDHVSISGPPVPQLWSTVTTEEVCRSSPPLWLASSADIGDIADYWIFISPGPDGRCATADDVHRAIPFSAGPADSAVTLSGAPVAALHDAARRRTGYLLRNGSSLVRVNADFGAPTTIPVTGGAVSIGLLGRQAPRYWLFNGGGGLPTRLSAYDLVNGGPPVPVVSLGTGEIFGGPLDITTEEGTAFLRFTNLGSNTVRVLRLDDNLSTQVLATVSPGSLIQAFESGLRTTSSRVVIGVGGGLYSIPKSGGAPLLISSAASPYLGFGFMTAGENVWYPSAQNVAFSSKLAVVRDDGTNRATIDLALWAGLGSDFFRPLLPAACGRECRHAALTLNVGPLNGISTNPGSEIVTYDGATRTVIATHGRYPAMPELAFGTLVSTPRQLGQRGLANFFGPTVFDIFLFKTDASGLVQAPLN